MVREKLTGVQKVIVGLTIFTALSHIIYSYGWDNEILGINMGVWFVINGIGYLVLLYLLYFVTQFQDKRQILRYGLGIWTIGSIIAWALFHTTSERYTTLLDASLINKSIELLILIFLYVDLRQSTVLLK